MRQMMALLVVACLCAMVVGCSTPVGQYFARRGADLADCGEGQVGLGWPVAASLFPRTMGRPMEPPAEGAPPAAERRARRALLRPELYLRLRMTDFFVFGNGFAQPVCTGWRGRYRPAGSATSLAAGLPIYRNHEEEAGTTVHTEWTVLTRRTYDEAEPSPGGKVAESAWISFSFTLIVSLKAGLNPVELGDFLAGWFGLDILGDDDWHLSKKGEKK